MTITMSDENFVETVDNVHEQLLKSKPKDVSDNLPSNIKKKIKGWNLLLARLKKDPTNEKLSLSLNRQSIGIAEQIQNFLDNEYESPEEREAKKAKESEEQEKAEAAKKEADEKAKQEAEAKAQAQADADAKAKENAEESEEKEAEKAAKKAADEKAQADADAKAKENAESEDDKDEDSKVSDDQGVEEKEAEKAAKKATDEKAQADADVDAKAKEKSDAKTNKEEDSKAQEEADKKPKGGFGNLVMEKKILAIINENGDGRIRESALQKIIQKEPDYPEQKVHSITLRKVFLTSEYRLM